MIERGIARDGYRCLNEAGEAIWRGDERIAFPDAGQEHRARLRAASDDGNRDHDSSGNSFAEMPRASSGNSVLQAAQESAGGVEPDRPGNP